MLGNILAGVLVIIWLLVLAYMTWNIVFTVLAIREIRKSTALYEQNIEDFGLLTYIPYGAIRSEALKIVMRDADERRAEALVHENKADRLKSIAINPWLIIDKTTNEKVGA